MKLSVNGQSIDSASKPGQFVEVKRSWHSGDKVQVALPMHLSMERLPGSNDYVAFLYGPIVLSGALGTEGLSKLDFWQLASTVGRKTIPEVQFPQLVATSPQDLLKHIQPVTDKPVTFKTDGGLMKPAEVDLIPFYQNHYQRYAVYWHTLTPGAYQQQQKQLEAESQRQHDLDIRSIDHIKIGDSASESAHAFKGQRTNTGAGAYSQRMETRWRDAGPGGWFSYEVKVLPDKPVTLSCLYWGQESGDRTFDILVNDKIVTTTTLADRGVADFYTIETPIPLELSGGHDTATIRFQPHAGNTAGGVFDLRILPSK
jgi:hypothetical protein